MNNIGRYDIDTQPIDRNDVCHVCKNEVGSAHQCVICDRYIHLFCGIGQNEEGYGQKAVCKHCVGK